MGGKGKRILSIYQRVLDGKAVNKSEEAFRFGVNERTIQRDLDDIRKYLGLEIRKKRQLIYDRDKKGYLLVEAE